LAVLFLGLLACGRSAPLIPRDGQAQPPPDAQSADAGPTDTGMRPPCFESRVPLVAWQFQRAPTVVCFPKPFTTNGEKGEYDFAKIPSEDDPDWAPLPLAEIDFADHSRLCPPPDGGPAICPCRGGADFTYFQTGFELDQPARSFTLSIGNVDDGARLTLFNSKHAEGFVAGFALLFSAATFDLTAETAAGHNRLAVTHVDDCCKDRKLTGVLLQLDGEHLAPCE
jgi:hypothetical protein